MKRRRREVNRLSQAVLTLSAKTISTFPLKTVQLIFALAVVLGAAALFCSATAQRSRSREVAFAATLQWNRQKGITRYRLQIAGDEKIQGCVVRQAG